MLPAGPPQPVTSFQIMGKKTGYCPKSTSPMRAITTQRRVQRQHTGCNPRVQASEAHPQVSPPALPGATLSRDHQGGYGTWIGPTHPLGHWGDLESFLITLSFVPNNTTGKILLFEACVQSSRHTHASWPCALDGSLVPSVNVASPSKITAESHRSLTTLATGELAGPRGDMQQGTPVT